MQKSPLKILAAGLLAAAVCPAVSSAQDVSIRAVPSKGRVVFTNIEAGHTAPLPAAVVRTPEPGPTSGMAAKTLSLPVSVMRAPLAPPPVPGARPVPVVLPTPVEAPTEVVVEIAGVPPSLGALVRSISRQYGVDPALVSAVIKAESNFNRWAVSSKGARGLMQLIPETGRRFGVEDFFDPRQNIEGGVRYLKFLLDKFGGNVELSVAAYNAGEGIVERLGRVPPYNETREYVRRVRQMYPKKTGWLVPEPEPLVFRPTPVVTQTVVPVRVAVPAVPVSPPVAKPEAIPAASVPPPALETVRSAAPAAVVGGASEDNQIYRTRDARGVILFSNMPK